MKSIYSLLAIVAVAALSSCAALNTPVYHDDYGTPTPHQTQQLRTVEQYPSMPAAFKHLPPAPTADAQYLKRTRSLNTSRSF